MARPKAIVPVTQDQHHIKILVYGDPGVGKTRLVGTSPDCLILECDDGSESAAVAGTKADKWPIRDHSDLLEAYEYLRHEDHGYKWVWLDSLTLFQERGMDQIMSDLVAEKPHRKLWAPDKGEFGQNMNRISLAIRNIKELPVNFGITAHVLRTEDDDGKVLYMPAVQGRNMPDKICAYMGIVAYMYARRKDNKIERGLKTQKDSKFYAKDRFDAIPGGRLVNPTIPKLEELVSARLPAPSKVRRTTGRTKPRKVVR